jgi:hypothetical protein
MARVGIMSALGLKDSVNFSRHYLKAGLIE